MQYQHAHPDLLNIQNKNDFSRNQLTFILSHKMESKVKKSISQQATGGALLSEHSSKRQKEKPSDPFSLPPSRNTQLLLQVFTAQSISSFKTIHVNVQTSLWRSTIPRFEKSAACAKLEAKTSHAFFRVQIEHMPISKSACFHTLQKRKTSTSSYELKNRPSICWDKKGKELKLFVQNHTLVFYACKLLL